MEKINLRLMKKKEFPYISNCCCFPIEKYAFWEVVRLFLLKQGHFGYFKKITYFTLIYFILKKQNFKNIVINVAMSPL
jgi:hypothetical protein